jgi:phosphocarrier protein FPr/phosphocarrier protein
MLGLGLGHGAPIVIRAGGPDSEQAVEALSDLLESGMGELLPISKSVAAISVPQEGNEIPPELRGICAVPGIAIGRAWRLKNEAMEIAEDAQDMELELESLNAARERVASQLRIEAQAGEAAGAIAEAHLAMLADPVLDEAARQLISSGKSAAYAWRSAIEKNSEPLRQSNDPRFAERLDDLLDLERRLLRELIGDDLRDARPPAQSIFIAETIYPSQLKELAEAGIAGVATAAGGATSHASIIAAGLALPMLVGLGPKLSLIDEGTDLIIREDTLVVAPDAERLSEAKREAKLRLGRRAAAQARAHEPGVTADGSRIEVFANLGSAAEASVAVAQGAEGCGLLRTEFLFLDRDAPPDEAEQRQAYQSIADALGERPLIVRTLDIGADKPAPWLPMEAEDNPALGLRGIRLQLMRMDLLETQLRALLGVRARGQLRIMLPMVSTIAELRQTKSVLERLAREAKVQVPKLGIMVETPAAALISGALAEEAAFFSIGTNDLSQYALARDRTNPAVAKDLDGLDPAVLRLISETVRGAQAHGRVIGVCGGLAAVPEAIPLLIGLGVSELSVPSGAIAEVKAIVRTLDLGRCREVANQALAASDANLVRALAAPILEQRA